jgi:MFS transporter, SP family, general alpha glucoside:H+ symporter
MAKDIEASKNADAASTCVHLESKADLSLVDQAQQATEVEHGLKVREAFQIYRKAVLCAVIISTTIIMRLYDIVIINNFFALPGKTYSLHGPDVTLTLLAFQNHFGDPVAGHGHQIPARWQVALGNASLVGQVIGAFLVSYPMDWIGRKKTLQVSLCLQAAIIFMQFFASSIEVLTASEYLAGVVLGGYQVLIPTYSAELLPMAVRPYLAAYINICYSIGNLLVTGVSKGFSTWTSQWGYRIPFAIQWAWPVIILPALIFVPESPWYLIAKDRVEDAEKVLRRLISPSPKVDLNKTLALMQKTHLYEKKIESGTTVAQCFKGSSLRRSEIVIMIFFVQDFAGSTLSTTYFFEQLNLTTTQAFDISVGLSATSFVCTCLAGFLLRYFGRRSVYTIGIIVVALLNILIGILSLPTNYWTNAGYSWAQVGLAILSAIAFQLTIGPLCYTILTEVPSAKLRAKTVSVAIATDALCGIVTSTIQPYLLSPSEANAGAKANFLWGGLSIISVLWCYFRLPETKHRTVEELDYMFEHKVPSRQFKSYKIDPEALKHNLEE